MKRRPGIAGLQTAAAARVCFSTLPQRLVWTSSVIFKLIFSFLLFFCISLLFLNFTCLKYLVILHRANTNYLERMLRRSGQILWGSNWVHSGTNLKNLQGGTRFNSPVWIPEISFFILYTILFENSTWWMLCKYIFWSALFLCFDVLLFACIIWPCCSGFRHV